MIMKDLFERLEYARKQKGKTYEELGSMIGIGGPGVNMAIRRKSLKPHYVNIIAEKLGVTQEWLEHGTGDMNGRSPNDMESVKEYLKQEARQISFEDFMEAEYLPVTAQAGYLNSLIEDTPMELSKMLVPREFEKGNYAVIEITGPSMDDNSRRAICDGDKLLVKQVNLNEREMLKYRQNLYVILSKEGIVCKQILSHDVLSGEIECHSFNSAYSDYTLNMQDILKICAVKKIVERKPQI